MLRSFAVAAWLLLPRESVASVVWGLVDRRSCVTVELDGASLEPFCFDFVREDVVSAAREYCAAGSRCSEAHAAALAKEGFAVLRRRGDEALAKLRRRFECLGGRNSTTQCASFGAVDDESDYCKAGGDAMLIAKAARTRFEAQELLNGRLPPPEDQCFQHSPEHAKIRACPLTKPYAQFTYPADMDVSTVGASLTAAQWARRCVATSPCLHAVLSEKFAEDEFYEHAIASMLHAYELGLRADDRQRANVADLQVALMAAGWGELDVATPLFGRVVAEAAELALEQGPGDAAERWDALARAARLDAAMSVPPAQTRIVPGVDDLRLYRNLLRDDLAAMGRPEAWGKPLSQAAQRDLVGHVGRTLFHLAHQCENEVLEMRLLGAALRAAAPEVLAVDAVASEAADSVETVHDSIRIGFVSTYLTEHSIGKMLGEVLGLLSNHALIEECFAFHVVANVGDYDGRDHVRNFIDASTKAVEVARHDLVGQRMAILGAKLDVLVFPDVGMEASTYFLAFARLARVQCVWWGHPTTTGLETVDYYLSLDTEVSDADSMYDEQLVRLEHVNTAPFVEADLWRDSSPKHISDFLPLEDDARLYVVLGRLFKLHPLFDDILVDLLSRDTEGVVVLIGEPQRALNSRLWSRVSGAVKRAVADADLKDSVLRRIVFVDYWNYLHVLANAAVVLDTFPYGGCLTALDSLSNGVPLITLPSQFERGRFAMSIYQQMNFTQLVARDEAHFVELAVTVANDSRLREETVQRLRRHYPAAHRPQSVADEWAPLFHKLARHT